MVLIDLIRSHSILQRVVVVKKMSCFFYSQGSELDF